MGRRRGNESFCLGPGEGFTEEMKSGQGLTMSPTGPAEVLAWGGASGTTDLKALPASEGLVCFPKGQAAQSAEHLGGWG